MSSELFDQEDFDQAPPRRSHALAITVGAVIALLVSLSVFSGIWTEKLWFDSTGYSSVFNKLIGTRVMLFVVFGLLMALAVGGSTAIAFRARPFFRAGPDQASLDRYRDVVLPMRRLVWLGSAALVGAFAGMSAAGQWRSFLMWRHGVPFGSTDSYFGRDLGFYVFDLPWWHFVVDFAMATAVISLIAAAVVHYLFGGIALQGRDRVSPAAQAQLSALLGFFVLAKGADYWLSRYDLLSTNGRLITGMTYTNDHAVLPARNIMTGIALICAVLFFVNVWRRTWTLPVTGLALTVVSSILLGILWPGIVQRFQVTPSQADKEESYIQKNIDATREAYDITDVEETVYPGSVSVESDQLREDAFANGIRLVDPSLVAETFEQRQQIKGYYSVAPVLDVDRYEVNGRKRDLVVSVREVDQNGVPDSAKNWNNLHTVYTHGYGMVGAFGNQRDATDQQPAPDGEIAWAEQDLPPQGVLSDTGEGYEGRVYFGEQSPSYSIVGKPDGGSDIELDLPEDATSASNISSTYDGTAGVEIGGLFRKLLYAVKYGEPNIVLSSRVHENSKILYDRHPREMVEKVAPWLTVDRDPFPAVVDGRILWIMDGYTVTDRYPLSQKESFESMTDDSLDDNTTFRTLPTDEINYLRNAVKATVDAYDGTVTLYAWDEEDPMLKAWDAAFPGSIKDRSEIPDSVLEHLRYPEDMFKVQRYQLASYHVTDAADFYAKNDEWKVPQDPNVPGKQQPPYRLSVATPDSGGRPVFSLTSVYTPFDRDNLAAFVSVDADASDAGSYGKISVLSLRGGEQVPGPGQIANAFATDESLRDALLRYTQNDSARVISGNLLTLPVGQGLMYVQPIYTRRTSGDGTYPVPRFVAVSFGDEVGFGRNLDEAISDILGVAPVDPGTGEQPPPTEGPTGKVNKQIARLLDQANAAYLEADRLQAAGDTVGWAREMEVARDLIQQAIDLADTSRN